MDDESIKVVVNRLTGPENWGQWLVKLKISLMSRKLIGSLRQQDIDAASDDAIDTLSVIIPTLSDDTIQKLEQAGWQVTTTTPAKTMKLLEEIIMGTACDNIWSLVEQINRCTRSSFNTLADWLKHFTFLHSQLMAADGTAISDKVYVGLLLMAIKETNPTWHAQWTHDIARDANSVKSKTLLEFLGKQASAEKQGVFAAIHKSRRQRGESSQQRDRKEEQQQQEHQPPQQRDASRQRRRRGELCMDCPATAKGWRHEEAECWKKYPQKAPADYVTKAGQNQMAGSNITIDESDLASFGMTVTNGIDRNMVILDGGCSQHTFNDKKWFKTLQMTSKEMIGASSPLRVVGVGKVIVQQGKKGVILHNSNYAPESAVNMISEGKLFEENALYNARDNLVEKGGKTILHCSWVNKVKTVPNAIPQPAENLAMIVRQLPKPKTVPYSVLHHRLMHANADRIIKLCKKSGFPIDEQEAREHQCEACLLSKSTPLVSRVTVHKMANFLDMVHWDFIHHDLGFGGLRYSLHAIDSATGYHWLLCVPDRTASTLTKKIDLWHRDVVSLSGTKPKIYFMDSAKEFLSSAMESHCERHQIKLLTHAPNVSEQHGRIERANRTIQEMARTIRIQALLPKFLWPFLMQSAVKIINMLPTAANHDNESPVAKMNRILRVRKAPNITYLRAIGCVAYVHKNGPNVPARSDKLEARAVRGQLVGYDGDNGHIYFVYLPRGMSGSGDATVARVRDVRFIERLPGDMESLPLAQLEDMPIAVNNAGAITITLGVNKAKQAATSPPQINEQEPQQQNNTTTNNSAKQIDARQGTQGLTPPPDEWSSQGQHTPHNDSDDEFEDVDDANPAMTLIEEELDLPVPPHHVAWLDVQKQQSNEFGLIAYQPDVGDQDPVLETAFVMPDADAAIRLPTTFREATKTSHRDAYWRPAMIKQLDRLRQMGTWKLVKRPATKVLNGKWVFTETIDQDGNQAPKARWVACGIRSKDDGFDSKDLYAAVAHATSVRLFLTIVATMDLEWAQGDFKSAFLNAAVKRDVYVEQPTGFRDGDAVCHLHKALYGIPDAPRWWQETLTKKIQEFGWEACEQEPCLFRRKQQQQYLIVYVDDFKLAGPSQDGCQQAIEQLANAFELTVLHEKNKFLGVQIRRNRENRTIMLSQPDYVQKAVCTFGYGEYNGCKMPWPSGLSSTLPMETKDTSENTIKSWRAQVGQLIWISIMTRPDITFTVSRLATGNMGPTSTQQAVMKQLWRYLKGTVTKGVVLGGWDAKLSGLRIHAYSDASFADNVPSRASTGGYVVMAGCGPILWKSKRQTIVTTSTTEAEFINLTPAGVNLLWICQLADELGFAQKERPILYTDSQNAFQTVLNPLEIARTKHIDVKYKWVIDQAARNALKLERISTNRMTADGLTKGLNLAKHVRFCELIGMSK